jgi:hypothetical protein
MKQIIWKKIKNYKGYQVSNMGLVRSVDRIINQKIRPQYNWTFKRLCRGKIIKGDIEKRGYIRVMLTNRKRELVHRLVAQTFIPNPKKKFYINHLDNNPSNNNVDNLEWVTHKENMQHCKGQGRQSKIRALGENCGASKLLNEQVIKIRKLRFKMSYRKIGKMFGVNHSSIKNIMLRRTWKHI